MADELGRTLGEVVAGGRMGRAYNTEELRALKNAVTGQALRVDDLKLTVEALGDAATPALRQALGQEQSKLLALSRIFEGGRAEAGRAMRVFLTDSRGRLLRARGPPCTSVCTAPSLPLLRTSVPPPPTRPAPRPNATAGPWSRAPKARRSIASASGRRGPPHPSSDRPSSSRESRDHPRSPAGRATPAPPPHRWGPPRTCACPRQRGRSRCPAPRRCRPSAAPRTYSARRPRGGRRRRRPGTTAGRRCASPGCSPRPWVNS